MWGCWFPGCEIPYSGGSGGKKKVTISIRGLNFLELVLALPVRSN